MLQVITRTIMVILAMTFFCFNQVVAFEGKIVDLIWKKRVGKSFTHKVQPVIFGNKILISNSRKLCVLNERGSVLWEFSPDNDTIKGFLPCSDHIFVVGCKNLYFLSWKGSVEKRTAIKFNSRIHEYSYEHGEVSLFYDLTGDGVPDVLVADWYGAILLDGKSGKLVEWYKERGVKFFSVGDVNNDKKVEVVFSSGTDSGRSVYSVRPFNWEYNIWRFSTYDPEKEEYEYVSSPVLGDINDDGTPDVVVLGGPTTFYRYGGVRISGREGTAYALDGKDGSILWKYKICRGDRDIDNFPVIGDVDNDGKEEVIFSSCSNLYVLNGEDGTLLWKRKLGDAYLLPGPDINYLSPVVADINGDGKLDIILSVVNLIKKDRGYSVEHSLQVLDGKTGSVLWKFYFDTLVSSPILGDLDRNGKIDIVVLSGGVLYRFESTQNSGEIVWSKWKGDILGTNSYWNAVTFAEANTRGNVVSWRPQAFMDVKTWARIKSYAAKVSPLVVFVSEKFEPSKDEVLSKAKIRIATVKALRKARILLLREVSKQLRNTVAGLYQEAGLNGLYSFDEVYAPLLAEVEKTINTMKGKHTVDLKDGEIYLLLSFPEEELKRLFDKASQLIAQALEKQQNLAVSAENTEKLNKIMDQLSSDSTSESDDLLKEAREFERFLAKFNREREETKRVFYEALKAYREAAGELFKYSSPKTREFIEKWSEANKKVNQLKETFRLFLQESDKLFSLLYREARNIKDDQLRLQMLSLIREKEFNFYSQVQEAIRNFIQLNKILQDGNDTIKAIKIAGALHYVDKKMYKQIDVIECAAEKAFKQLSNLTREGQTILSKLITNP